MICLDSTVVIDFLRGVQEAIAVIKLHKEGNVLITTEITKFEIFLGINLKHQISEKEAAKAKEFFSSVSVLPFDDSCGEEAAKIYVSLSKKGEIIEQNDVFISAIMNKNGCNEIITRNKKDFLKITGIKVIGY